MYAHNMTIPTVPKVSIRLAASGMDLDLVEADSSSPCCLGAGGSLAFLFLSVLFLLFLLCRGLILVFLYFRYNTL
jgi:hypothetical protein